ncbi:50S ribosomal protein L15 [Patescibacteria group bacterium]|nr:MAG: 50S ribosomal protein L15 [Patescibacteria group bacterium]
MKIHELTVTKKANSKRVGRGIGSGTGKTAGRGTKGQNSRSGGGVRPGFEGGQNPLAKRLPKKRGFRSLNPTNYAAINLARLDELKAGSTVTNQSLAQDGWVDDVHTPVKILGKGTLTKKLTVQLQAASATAQQAIEKAGGSFVATALAKRPKQPSARNRKS